MLKEKPNKGSSRLLSRWLSGSQSSKTLSQQGHGKENVREQRELELALEMSLMDCQPSNNEIDDDDWFQASPTFTKRQYQDTPAKRRRRKDQDSSTAGTAGKSSATSAILASPPQPALPPTTAPAPQRVKEESSTQQSGIEIEDFSSWINLKTEQTTQAEDQFEIDDFSAWIDDHASESSPPDVRPRDPITSVAVADSAVSTPTDNMELSTPPRRTAIKRRRQTERTKHREDAEDATATITTTTTITASSSSARQKESTIECPLCMRKYQRHIIEHHASECTGRPHTTVEEIHEWQAREQSPIEDSWSDEDNVPVHIIDEAHALPETVMLSDSEDSECSVINLCDGREEEEEDEGYLSPLEGFVSLLDQRAGQQGNQRYFHQGSHPTPEQTSQRGPARSRSTTGRTQTRASTRRAPRTPRTQTRTSAQPTRRRGNSSWRYARKARQRR